MSERPRRILLTGASGALGRVLAPALAQVGSLRRADARPPEGGQDGENGKDGGYLNGPRTDGPGDLVVGDLGDPDVAARAVEGIDAVVHLAGIPTAGTPWPPLVQANVLVTDTLLAAASAAGVTRLVLASSVHVTGAYNDPCAWPVSPRWPAAPCCHYGASKATTELLAQLFAAERPGVSAVALRLGLVADRPRWSAEAKGWTPTAALPTLVQAALRARPGYQVHYAVARSAEPRYVTSGLERDLGVVAPDPVDPDLELPQERPEYAAECRLWLRYGSDYA